MSKGINRIIISDEHISNGQIIKFPQLLNGCEVYGLIANGNWVTLSVEMDEKVFLDVEDKVKNKQIHSGIKWVYGKVYNLQKGGISWHGWYTDTNRNNKKDENEEWVNNKPVEQISKIDLYNVQGNYTIQKTIQIKFDNKPYDTPALSWVEPFLIHPELHFSKKPKGIFIVPIAEPKIYRADLLINNSPFDRKLQIPLPKTEKESQENENVVYYGENLIISAHVCTLLIPESAEFTVNIFHIDHDIEFKGHYGVNAKKKIRPIYEKKVNGLKLEHDNFWSEDLDYELVSYLSQYFKRAELLIPLALDNKPKNQKEKTKRTFFVTLKHIYQAYSATNTDFKKLYPIQQGYLTIGYTDMENLLEIQNKEVDEYVEKTGDVLLQPNGEPCHYTWIKAHKKGKVITLFEEKKEGIKFDPIEIGLIAGDENPYLLTLSANLKTEECKTQQHTKGADSIFYFPAKLSSEKQGIKIQKIDYSSVDLLIPYKYIRDHNALGMVNLFPFNYLWLNEKDVQKHVIMVDTCRYTIPVKINVYPDIEWTFHINYGMKNPLYYRDTWVNMRQHRVDAAIKKGQAADIDGYDGNIETTFSLSLQAKYGNTTLQLDKKIAKKTKLFLESFIKIKKFVDDTTGKNRDNSTHGMGTDILKRINRTPLNIEVLSPKLAIGAGWKFTYGRKEQDKNNIVAFYLGLIAKASPVIGAEATIDLIAWGKKLHPLANAVITALDLLAYAANAEVRFDLIFYGKLIIDGKIELSRLLKQGYLKAEGQFGFELILKASATGKLNLYYTQVDLDFEAKAQSNGYFALGLSAGLDDYKGLYFKPNVRHSGIKITLSLYVKVNGFKKTKKEEFTVIKEGKLEIDKKYYIHD